MALCSGEPHGTVALQKGSCQGREVSSEDWSWAVSSRRKAGFSGQVGARRQLFLYCGCCGINAGDRGPWEDAPTPRFSILFEWVFVHLLALVSPPPRYLEDAWVCNSRCVIWGISVEHTSVCNSYQRDLILGSRREKWFLGFSGASLSIHDF